MSEIDQKILENAYKIAKTKGIKTKSALAKKAGTTPQTLNNIQDGTRSMGKSIKKKLADALHVKESELLPAGSATPPPSSTEPPWELKALITSLQSNINALTDRVNALKNYTEAQESRLLEQKKQIGTITAALLRCEEQKDFLPLGTLRDTGT